MGAILGRLETCHKECSILSQPTLASIELHFKVHVHSIAY